MVSNNLLLMEVTIHIVHELPPAALLLEVGLVFVRGGQLIGLEVERPQSRAAPWSGASPPVSGLCKLRLHPHPTGRVQSCRTLPQHLPSPSSGRARIEMVVYYY